MVRLHRIFPIWKTDFNSLGSALSLVLVDSSGVSGGYNFKLNNLFSIFTCSGIAVFSFVLFSLP